MRQTIERRTCDRCTRAGEFDGFPTAGESWGTVNAARESGRICGEGEPLDLCTACTDDLDLFLRGAPIHAQSTIRPPDTSKRISFEFPDEEEQDLSAFEIVEGTQRAEIIEPRRGRHPPSDALAEVMQELLEEAASRRLPPIS